MWVKRLIVRLRHYWILRRYRDHEPMAANRKECEEILNLLDPREFEKYVPMKTAGQTITTRVKALADLVEKIHSANQLLVEETPVPRTWYTGQEQTMTLDSFISIRDNHYIPVGATVMRLKNEGLQLCKLMVASDTETVGLHEHNLRVLTTLFVDLRTVSQRLLSLSYS